MNSKQWRRTGFLVFTLTLLSCVQLQAQTKSPQRANERKPILSQHYEWLQKLADDQPKSLSYLARDWSSPEQWRIRGRAKMQSLLAYEPSAAPLNARTLDSVEKEGFTRHRIHFSVTPNRETEAYLLIPHGLKQPAPAVVCLHDHGGFYYFGKEKVTKTENQPKVLENFIDKIYGGRTYADELARKGFVVVVPDAFYFGSQRLDADQVDRSFTKELRGEEPSSDSYIRAFNRFARSHETLTAKGIFVSGSTWPGILFQGDRACVDYLLTRPEVDPDRIGCIGLSIGGYRSAHLAGLDPRIKAAVVAGWMTSYGSLVRDHLRSHTWMVYVPGQLQYLDLPDVVALNAPNHLMVINCLQDQLFTLKGMQDAETKIRSIYRKMGASDRFLCNYYDVPHSLNVEMQDDAIEFLSRSLR